MSCWMSSSRVQITFTGPSTFWAMRTDFTTMSVSSLRPKPPPSIWLWKLILSGVVSSVLAAAATALVCTWLPPHISQPPSFTWTVKFCGSIGACDRNGNS